MTKTNQNYKEDEEEEGEISFDEAHQSLTDALQEHPKNLQLTVNEQCFQCQHHSQIPLGVIRSVSTSSDNILRLTLTNDSRPAVTINLNDDAKHQQNQVRCTAEQLLQAVFDISRDELVIPSQIDTCDRKQCQSTLKIMETLGLLTYWNDDTLSSDRVLSHVANTCTGKYKIFEIWKLLKNDKTETKDDLQTELLSRKRCPRCDRSYPGISAHKLYCLECFKKISTESRIDVKNCFNCPYDEEELPSSEIAERRQRLKWLEKLPKLDNQPFVAPCVKCTNNIYKRTFYFGYRPICSRCLFDSLKNGVD